MVRATAERLTAATRLRPRSTRQRPAGNPVAQPPAAFEPQATTLHQMMVRDVSLPHRARPLATRRPSGPLGRRSATSTTSPPRTGRARARACAPSLRTPPSPTPSHPPHHDLSLSLAGPRVGATRRHAARALPHLVGGPTLALDAARVPAHTPRHRPRHYRRRWRTRRW
jgi:hypothetical protein